MKIAIVLLALLPLPVKADTYRCTDAAGTVSYSDRPCGGTQSGKVVVVKPQSAPDEQRQRELAEERRINRAEDAQRRANFAASEERERADRASAGRAAERECNYAREQAAYHAGYVKGGADARVYEVHKSQLQHYEEQIARYCH